MKKIHLPARMDAAQEEFDPMKFEAVQKNQHLPMLAVAIVIAAAYRLVQSK